jgi:hypothetical protein
MFVPAGRGTRFSCVCYLATLLCLDYVALNDRILGELERNSKGEVVVQSTEVLHGDSSAAIEKNHEIFDISGVLAQIQPSASRIHVLSIRLSSSCIIVTMLTELSHETGSWNK